MGLTFTHHLVAGDAEVRVEMAEALADLTLTTEGKARAGENVSRTLVEMLGSSSSSSEKAAALRALSGISTLESNGSKLMEAGVLVPLMRDLFVVGPNMVPMKLKEVAATILANVVNASGMWESIPIDVDGNTLTSEAIVHNFLHLISNTGPAIEAKLLLVLAGKRISSKSTILRSPNMRHKLEFSFDKYDIFIDFTSLQLYIIFHFN